MAADVDYGPLQPGGWAVLGNGGVVHAAELVGGLPRGSALCGAVGTAFIVSSLPRSSRVCERCAELAGGGADAGPR